MLAATELAVGDGSPDGRALPLHPTTRASSRTAGARTPGEYDRGSADGDPAGAHRPSRQTGPVTWSPPDTRRPAALPVGDRPRRHRRPRPRREDLLTLAVTTAVTVLLGAPVGLIWSALAPHAHVRVQAGVEPYIPDATTEVFIAGDGWFIGLTLLLGVVCGVLAWLVARRSGPFVVVGLAAGGLVAAYVASRVGMRIGQDALRAAVSSGRQGTYVGNVALQAKAALVVWPLGAVAAFATLVAARVDELD